MEVRQTVEEPVKCRGRALRPGRAEQRSERQGTPRRRGLPGCSRDRLRLSTRRTVPGVATVCTPPRSSGRDRGGSSTWQSLLARGTVEVDYLNGEVVLLGRLHGVPVPANVLLQRLVNEKAWEHSGPGGMDPGELLALLDRPF